MAASARPGGRATSFAVACSLLSRFVRQNGAAAAELGLGIKGERGRSRVWLLRLVAFGGRLQKIYFFCVGAGMPSASRFLPEVSVLGVCGVRSELSFSPRGPN